MLFRKKREKKVKEKRTTDIQVIDEDWEPVKDAKVILFTGRGSGRIYHTNENGRCRVKLPPATQGFIEIKVIKKGYRESIDWLTPYQLYKRIKLYKEKQAVEKSSVTKKIIYEKTKDEFVFRSIESAIDEFERTVRSQIQSETYDQEIVRYFDALGKGLKVCGNELKNNILRGRYDNKEAILEYILEFDRVAGIVIIKSKEILTSRMGLYLLRQMKLKSDGIETANLGKDIAQLIDRALRLESVGVIEQEVKRLCIEVDREITEAMRKGINGYFFSSLYRIFKDLNVKHAYVVLFLLLSTIKLMLNSHSIRTKLKGIV
jgi:hypothetical protein